MKLRKFLTVKILLAPELRITAMPMVSLLIVILASAGALSAQPAADPPHPDQQTIQTLMERIDRLEARVAQLEGAKRPATTETTAQAPSPPEPMPATVEPERMDLSKTLLHIRGFGDVTYHGDNRKGDTTSFSLGQLNLFVTSDVSEKFRFLSEIVFEAGPDNAVGVDVERLLLQYSPNDYFNLSAGRYHTAIGYYNTAYHHSTWLQTATGRPLLFEFEDKGGILPIHNVGVSATGLIPSGSLGLHYVAEVGNGRASSSARAEAVQNLVDENNLKAFNLALFVRPEKIRGLQVGFSGYRDVLTPLNQSRIGETILDAYGVIVRPNFEWLNEALVIRHAPEGLSRVFQTPGFYSQVSKRFGSYRPYFRYQYVNAPDHEPIFGPVYNAPVGLRHGPSAGLRYDASESVAVKLQYDYTLLRNQQAISGLALQLGFTF
ncbi:MAG: hypothetical protein DMG70_14165 [Acidobacteria bacterium]|nr:MAG: hypothetical protein DMG70_14165 [Acidobacteriota bacterium]PYY07300.1 MAG: hypothetical protein DMG69_19760 [Acidobacteriota bacterium]